MLFNQLTLIQVEYKTKSIMILTIYDLDFSWVVSILKNQTYNCIWVYSVMWFQKEIKIIEINWNKDLINWKIIYLNIMHCISQIMLDQYNFISDIRFCKILCLGGNIAFIILIQTFPYLKMQSKKISRLYLAINGNYIISLCKVRFSVIFGQNQRASKKKLGVDKHKPILNFQRVTFISINTLSI